LIRDDPGPERDLVSIPKAFAIVKGEFIISDPVSYFIGIASTTHFANGLWLFLVDWGVTVGQQPSGSPRMLAPPLG
jgi:succinate dehydrogenase/fumarate reductase cytochrome b subunit